MFNFDIAINDDEVMFRCRYGGHFLALMASGSIKQCVFWNVSRFGNIRKLVFFCWAIWLINGT